MDNEPLDFVRALNAKRAHDAYDDRRQILAVAAIIEPDSFHPDKSYPLRNLAQGEALKRANDIVSALQRGLLPDLPPQQTVRICEIIRIPVPIADAADFGRGSRL